VDKSKVLSRIQEITSERSKQQEMRNTATKISEFIANNQWIFLDDEGRVKDIPRDESYRKRHRKYRNRETVNIIFPLWKTFLAYLIKTTPQFKAQPQLPEDVADEIGAGVATVITSYMYEELVIKNLAQEIYGYLLQYGTTILHPRYNKVNGLIEMIPIPPSQIFVYPRGATSWRNVRGVCWERNVPVDLVKSKYPKEAKDLKGSSGSNLSSLAPERQRHESQENSSILRDYWELPSEEHKGLMYVTADDKIMWHTDKYPYQNKDDKRREYVLPFFRLFDNWLPGSLWGFPTLNIALPRQQSLNIGKSKLADLISIFPKLVVDNVSNILLERMLDPDQTYIEFNSMGGRVKEPHFTSPALPSPALIREITEIPQEVEHSLGQHEVMVRARAPSSVHSGTAIESLKETDASRMTPTLECVRLGLTEAMNYVYFLVKDRYSRAKIKNILGEMGELDIMAFYDTPLKPMNFTIEPTTFSPFAKRTRQTQVQNLLTQGLFPKDDPRAIREILNYFEPELAEKLDPDIKEMKLQRMENYRMLQGEKIEVNDDDKDEIHLEQMDRIVKNIRFTEWQKNNKKKAENILAHKATHKKNNQRKAKEAMEMMKQANMAGKGVPMTGQGGGV